jgi:hypothetical protein
MDGAQLSEDFEGGRYCDVAVLLMQARLHFCGRLYVCSYLRSITVRGAV